MKTIQQKATKEFHELNEDSPKNIDFRSDYETALSVLAKNRYPDVLALEKTRVHLKKLNSEGSDYINANYLLHRQYISCQAPLSNTFSDFWRMIWEQNTTIIVMLTRLTECGRIKANTYWPPTLNGSSKFGDISVIFSDESQTDYYILRTFKLSINDEEVRSVHQFHFQDWPDFGVPRTTRGIRSLCSQMNSVIATSNSIQHPIVIHCSAGIGRSGSFIAIHYIISRMDKNMNYNVLATAKKMRRQRTGMIQTEEQYRFILQSILDHINETQMFLTVSNSIVDSLESPLKMPRTRSPFASDKIVVASKMTTSM
eukprot:TRINITY_DN6659_c0_g1_i1.p1 TRINITY_DN6659_c0_g1~~TRINITY_DN6659_c0_g1_i1.p1  ORF type:complete len:313 (-),score=31.94 TRINITY_DN6659_c0_g1_i1:47-985(-)